MEHIVSAPSAPLIDGHRAFRGKTQLSPRDREILAKARRHGIVITHAGGETIFTCGGETVPRNAVLRLYQLRHLIDGDPGLFPGLPQRLVVNLTR